MINFKEVSLRRATKFLFEGATFTIHRGWKVGVTGGNGCGKSSLFAMLLGELHSDMGDCSIQPDIVTAHVAQEMEASGRPAIEFVIDGDSGLREIEAEIAEADKRGDGVRHAELYAQLESIDGFGARARAAKLMSGLGFRADQIDLPVASFSGGWRMRLNLARALMCRSDLLLLDEPTNHLDLDAVIWLQEWLQSYPGTLMLISHDRDFLDSVAGAILNIEHQKAELFSGNYSSFERIRAERIAQQQALFQNQQREVAKIRRFVDRFRAKATKARQAQSRLKALERMELIAAAHADSPFHFNFKEPEGISSPLLKMEQVATGYGVAHIIEQVSFGVEPGDRIGLLGPNGAGKSTLIKLMAGEKESTEGQLTISENIKIGYFAQHQLEQLDLDASPLLHLQRVDGQATEKELRNFLGGFGFCGDRALEPVGPFSGGEKARLVLSLLVYQKPNLLLLDEPTNHLDLEMRFALSEALQLFSGAMVIVSHDRHLLRTVCDRFMLVANGKVEAFEGDLDDYSKWMKQECKSENEENLQNSQPGKSRKQIKQEEAELRQRLRPFKEQLKQSEFRLEKLYSERLILEEALADSQLYNDENKERLKQVIHDKQALDRQVEEVELDWMAAQDALDEAINN